MEGKDLLRALLWAAVAFFVWQMIAVRIWPPPTPLAPVEAPAGGEEGGVATGDAPAATTDAPPDRATRPGEGSDLHVVAGSTERLILGDTSPGKGGPFRMEVVLTTIGASLVSADLSDHTQTAEADSPPYRLLDEVLDPAGKPYHSFTTEKIHIQELDRDVELGEVAWQVAARSADHVRFSAEIQQGNEPLLRLSKTFALPEQAHASMRHDLTVALEIENLTDEPRDVIVTYHGPVGIPQEDLRFNDRSAYVGVRMEGEVEVSGSLTSGIKESQSVYTGNPAGPLIWTALANKYFVVFDTPLPSENAGQVDWIRDVKNVHLTGDPAASSDVTFLRATRPMTLSPHGRVEMATDYYLGPKSRKAFKEVADYRERGYDKQVLASYSLGACSFMTFKSLTVLMIWLLNLLKVVVFNYGVAIIILVMIVRTILHPVTKYQQVNMVKMQERMGALAPKQEELRKRFGNDKTRLNQEMMKLYQQEGVNPAGTLLSCLPMLLQMPIWIALYTSLNFNIDMRHQPFLFWIHDLSAPDALIRFAGDVHIPLLSAMTGPINSFNLLPILVSASMFLQQKLMPKPKPAPGQSSPQSEQAAQMQKIMPYMLLVFGLMFYNMPSGLNLYIMASSFFGTVEQWRIRKHIEGLKKRGFGGAGPSPAKPTSPKKPKGPSFFERLQKAAQKAEQVKSQRPKSKPRR